MNDSAPVNKAQGQSSQRSINIHALDTLSLAALIPLSQAIFELADAPMIILSRLRDLVSGLCNQNREQDAIDLLYIVFGMLARNTPTRFYRYALTRKPGVIFFTVLSLIFVN